MQGQCCLDVSGHVLTCTCINCTWREALNCSGCIDFHLYMSGVRLIYLASKGGQDAHLVVGLETCNHHLVSLFSPPRVSDRIFHHLVLRRWTRRFPQHCPMWQRPLPEGSRTRDTPMISPSNTIGEVPARGNICKLRL